MTRAVKHMPRTPATDVNAADTRTRARNKQLRDRFPPRPVAASWPHTARSRRRSRWRWQVAGGNGLRQI